jgi:hypothetical protein
MAIPPFLYKYKAFSNFLLQELCGSEAYFASPTSFNDPLDSRPSIQDDLAAGDKHRLLTALYEEHEPKKDLTRVLDNFRYLATEYANGPEVEAQYSRSVSFEISRLLQYEIGQRGVLSLAERWNCPLMWSHYAHHHEGICLEYSTKDHVARNLLQVRYNTNRAISLDLLFDWKVKKIPGARQRVLELAFLSKAEAWSYEKEWRILARQPGAYCTPIELAGIYFGDRCSSALQTVVVKTLYDSAPGLKFYRVNFDNLTFDLRRRELNVDEVIHCGIFPSAALVFGRNVSALPIGVIPAGTAEPDLGPPYFQ